MKIKSLADNLDILNAESLHKWEVAGTEGSLYLWIDKEYTGFTYLDRVAMTKVLAGLVVLVRKGLLE